MTLVEDAFSALVDQFKDPFAFLRELVQNALDAGSTTIDVSATADGDVVTLEVQDTGDGMDRQIIETKLVRLFASSKDGDATKIGKFGIGFSSVFSIRPEAVVVDTARGGERWRVLFAPDGTWRLFSLDEPIEGTRVRVLKRAAGADVQARLIAEARATHVRWCRYADADIRFGGAPIREPFDIPLPVRVQVPLDAPGDAAVVALRTTEERVWGFYNKGLTLLEGQAAAHEVPDWVSFRVRDGALEHTITRDNVIRDDAYLRVLERVSQIARGPLLDAALTALEEDHPDSDAICRALLPALREGALASAARKKRRPFRDARGARVSLADIEEAARDDRLVRVDAAGPLADVLAADGKLVVRAPLGSGVGALLEEAGGPRALAHELLIATSNVSEKEQWDAAPLLHALAQLVAAAHVEVEDVILGRVDDATGALTQTPFVVAGAAGRPLPRATATTLPGANDAGAPRKNAARGAADKSAKKSAAQKGGKKGAANKGPANKSGAPVIVVNLECPAVVDALALARTDLWLAAFLLLRHLRAESAFSPQDEGMLAVRALELRSPS